MIKEKDKKTSLVFLQQEVLFTKRCNQKGGGVTNLQKCERGILIRGKIDCMPSSF